MAARMRSPRFSHSNAFEGSLTESASQRKAKRVDMRFPSIVFPARKNRKTPFFTFARISPGRRRATAKARASPFARSAVSLNALRLNGALCVFVFQTYMRTFLRLRAMRFAFSVATSEDVGKGTETPIASGKRTVRIIH